jgi:hypothetical protein
LNPRGLRGVVEIAIERCGSPQSCSRQLDSA